MRLQTLPPFSNFYVLTLLHTDFESFNLQFEYHIEFLALGIVYNVILLFRIDSNFFQFKTKFILPKNKSQFCNFWQKYYNIIAISTQ